MEAKKEAPKPCPYCESLAKLGHAGLKCLRHDDMADLARRIG